MFGTLKLNLIAVINRFSQASLSFSDVLNLCSVFGVLLDF